MSVNLLIARRHLMASKKQTLVAMLGVTFGIAMFILMISFMIGGEPVYGTHHAFFYAGCTPVQ